MKSMTALLLVLFMVSATYISGSYAEDNFVTSENLTIEDVDTFISALAREEAGMVTGSYITIERIDQRNNRAVVECEFCYVEVTFTNVTHAPRNIVFERTESGRWIHVTTGMFLTK